MSIYAKVLSFIETPRTETFERLALSVFRYQFENVAVYRQYCVARGASPESVSALNLIPAVSTVAFKYAELRNAGERDSPTALTFLTSGTSKGFTERGKHRVPHPEVYRASAIGHLRRMLFPDGARMAMLALHPTGDLMPESSLSTMLTWCIEQFGTDSVLCAATRSGVDTNAAIDFLADAQAGRAPVCILGTTAASAKLFESIEGRGGTLRLPTGSRLMDTGGAKGQVIPLTPDEVVARAHSCLGIEPTLVINEYGMTEMCSQLYDATPFNSDFTDHGGYRVKLPPPWLHPTILDPVTLRPAAEGQVGLIGFFDLANVGSISALITEDFGFVCDGAVAVLGRAAAGGARGCALSLEEFACCESVARDRPSPMKESISAVGQSRAHPSREVQAEVPTKLEVEVTAAQVSAIAARVRLIAGQPVPARRVAVALVGAGERWRDRDYAQRRETVGAVAAAWGWSEALLDESIDALIAPLNRFALENLARSVPRRKDVIGVIIPGNILGAGIHEFALGLLAGCALMIKTATAEPFFFARFTQTLREVDAEVGARVAVLNWSRERSAITSAFRTSCDWIAAFGNDDTIARLESAKSWVVSEAGGTSRLRVRFGNRVSGALVASELAVGPAAMAVADAIARDVSLFEQQGCLSPHHIFVESSYAGAVYEFARELAAALERFAKRSPSPRRYALEEAVAVRRVRESARWRGIGGSAVALMESEGLGWTVVCDDEASFTISPGYRTVTVSPFGDLEDLKRRLAPVAGRIEAFAIAAPGARLESLRAFLAASDICYICAPGAMQSPPLDWSHGGGAFLHALAASR